MSYKDPQKKKEHNQLYYQNNKERFRLYGRLWRKKNPEKARAICKKYRDANKDKRYIVCTKWRKNNPDKSRIIVNRYTRKIRKTSKGNLDHRMEVLIRNSLKNGKGGKKWEDLVGYTAEELKKHLEKQFKNGMTWKKFLNGEIHIDHKKPRSLFKYEKPEEEEFKQCWSLKNLQPLEKYKNLSKNNHYAN